MQGTNHQEQKSIEANASFSSQNANDGGEDEVCSNFNDQNDAKISFLPKLYDLINEPKTDDVICWLENGKGFRITNVHNFSSKILPAYFNQNKYASFIRQLNMYDF
jgi:hypothetical protein